jgi:hypothetical protein
MKGTERCVSNESRFSTPAIVGKAMEVPELRRLYQAIQTFREAMEADLCLNDFDRVTLENYIALLQITYIEWKRRNYRQPAYKRAA